MSARAMSKRWPACSAGPTSRAHPTSGSSPRSTTCRVRSSTRDGVDPLVREFYEHTTRFTLDIVPEWRAWVRPGYLLYRTPGRPAARAGERAHEPARGAAGRAQPHRHDQPRRRRGHGPGLDPFVRRHRRADLRRHLHDLPRTSERGYVSVGFPLPQANFTATLAAPVTGRRRPRAHQPQRPRAPGALPHLRRPGKPSAYRPRRPRLRRAARCLRRTRASCAPITRSGCSASRSSSCATASPQVVPSIRASNQGVATATYFVSRYSSMPTRPPSRPRPDCFTPPNGAAGFETIPG